MNMKETGIFIKRALFRFAAIILLILLISTCLFVEFFSKQISHYYNENHPREVLKAISASLKCSNDTFYLPTSQAKILSENKIWAMLLSPDGKVIWSHDFPNELPDNYSLNDVAAFSRSYLQDYPVFVWKHQTHNLLVIGYPKSTFMKFSNNFAPISIIKRLPIYISLLVAMIILLIFATYVISYRKTQKKLVPLIDGITKLSNGEYIRLPVVKDFTKLSESLNRTADILQQKELARSTWISGISHDIRTPLSIILGYSDILVSNTYKNDSLQKQAIIIRNQCIRIKQLIEDLNLFTNLEYCMQPLRSEHIYLKKFIRNIVIDFLNTIQSDKYHIILQCTIPDNSRINGDSHLLERGVQNLIQNSINHNPDGCTINVGLNLDQNKKCVVLTIADDGIGISQEKLQLIQNTKEYQYSYNTLTEAPHGLGLTLVKLIIETHNGNFSITNMDKGVLSTIILPIVN